LVVDDDPQIVATLAALLAEDFEVLTADGAEAAQRHFARRDIDLILADQKMPRMTGVQLLAWVRQKSPKTMRLLMTGFAELEEAIDAINKGQVFRYLFKPWQAEELHDALKNAARTFMLERSHELLLDQLRQLNQDLEKRVVERTRELQEAMHELEQKNKMLEKLALTDPLTSLPNRRAMDRLAEKEIRRRDRFPGPVAVALIDVDHFKRINDQYLLPGGDKVLVDLGKVMSSSLRAIDMLGRMGGEEFLLIAPETNLEGAKVLGERIRTTVETTLFAYRDAQISVQVSIGFAIAPESVVVDYERLKDLAAAALSEAKKTGRNRCVYFEVTSLLFDQAS
jgi:diguanylate cyclase (GGDEF)-like protein